METTTRRHIVVGVDGSPAARVALAWAARLAGVLDATVTAVHGMGLVEHVGDGLVTGHDHREQIEVAARRWCAPLAEAGLDHHIEVVELAAVDAVLRVAHRHPATLVVVGTRGRGLAPDRALGSTALRLLTRADVPVLVVPHAPTHRPPDALGRRLLVAFDGSPSSRAALAWARDLAARTGALCEVVAAAEEDPVFPLSPAATVTSEGEEHAPRRLHTLAEDAAAILRASGLPYAVTVRRGPAAPTIVAIAHAHGADLVVTGTEGAGPAGDPLLDSVSRNVVHDAGLPVVVVPDPARLAAASTGSR